MLAPVLQDVDQSVAHLARRSEPTRVVSVCPDTAAPTEDAVDRLRNADRETLHTTAQRRMRVALDQEMHMIVLNGEVHHPEAAP